jgi:hypothetical protein
MAVRSRTISLGLGAYPAGVVASQPPVQQRVCALSRLRDYPRGLVKLTLGVEDLLLAAALAQASPRELRGRLCLPEIDDKALSGLKFSDALPRHLAVATLATRLADLDHAAAVPAEPVRFARSL